MSCTRDVGPGNTVIVPTRKGVLPMTKVNRRISKGVIGVAFILVFMLTMLVYSTISNWTSVNAASNQFSAQKTKDKDKDAEAEAEADGEEEAKIVNGTAKFVVDEEKNTLTMTLKVKNLPPGVHAAHLHKGSCLLNFADLKQGPFNKKNNLLKLKPINGKKGLKQTIKMQNSIQASEVVGGDWFLCIHNGSLVKEIASLKAKDPEEKFNQLKEALEDPKVLAQVKQLVCETVAEGEVVIDGPKDDPKPAPN
jgi:hydrogenase maturation factor